MKIYKGVRAASGIVVGVNGTLLDPRYDLRNHSPTGFEWGYCGSGPAQLALAILADFLGDDDTAQKLYQEFKREVIAGIREASWSITGEDIRTWLLKTAVHKRN